MARGLGEPQGDRAADDDESDDDDEGEDEAEGAGPVKAEGEDDTKPAEGDATR